jgi:hypothetical protein
MLKRNLISLLVSMLLVVGAINLAHAGTDNGNGNDGQNNGKQKGHDSAPELSPSALGSGLVLLLGGVIILQERRRTQS